MKIIYEENNTKVVNCYLIKNFEIEYYISKIILERTKNNLPVTRLFGSYKSELKAHIRLYKLKYKIDHTKDADLEENISFGKELLYLIIGF